VHFKPVILTFANLGIPVLGGLKVKLEAVGNFDNPAFLFKFRNCVLDKVTPS
jgi:hypothetical protein